MEISQFAEVLGKHSSSLYDGAKIGLIIYKRFHQSFFAENREITVKEYQKSAFVRIHIQRKNREEVYDEMKITVILPQNYIKNNKNEMEETQNTEADVQVISHQGSVSPDADYSDRKIFAKFKKEEVYQFSQKTGDLNPIHMSERPIVQGMLLFHRITEYLDFPQKVELKFVYPIFAEQEIHISERKDMLEGFVNDRRCFQVKYQIGILQKNTREKIHES